MNIIIPQTMRVHDLLVEQYRNEGCTPHKYSDMYNLFKF